VTLVYACAAAEVNKLIFLYWFAWSRMICW